MATTVDRGAITRQGQRTARVNATGPFRSVGPLNQATLTTSLTGANNDLVFTSVAASSSSNSIRVRYVVAGNSTPLTVSVSGNDITVNVATDGSGVPTSTASDVAAAIAASPAAAALVTTANAPGNDGTGVVAAQSFTNLAGGTSFVSGKAISGLAGRPYTSGFSRG